MDMEQQTDSKLGKEYIKAVYCHLAYLTEYIMRNPALEEAQVGIKIAGRNINNLRSNSPFWRREWQSTPIFLPGESHGQRSLVGYSLRGCKELDA